MDWAAVCSVALCSRQVLVQGHGTSVWTVGKNCWVGSGVHVMLSGLSSAGVDDAAL